MLADQMKLQQSRQKGRAPQLSERKQRVLEGVCRGLTAKLIGRELDIPERTVEIETKTICRMLRARNRTHAAALAIGYYRMDIDVKPVER